jgi:hypothetical protein
LPTSVAAPAWRQHTDPAVAASAWQHTDPAVAASAWRSTDAAPARRGADAAVAAARVTAGAAVDAAAVAGAAARHGAGKVLRTAPVQQALQSKVGQQSQALGAAGARQARRLGDRTQQLWRERRADRARRQQHGHQPTARPTAQPALPTAQPALPTAPPELTSPSQYFPAQHLTVAPPPEPWRYPGP